MIYTGGYGIIMTAATTVRGEVLPDLQLPGVDWPDVHESLRQGKNLHRIPVVILTGSANPNTVMRSFEYAPDICIFKQDKVTGFNHRINNYGLFLPGRNGHIPGYLV
jgi:DNA-binding NarL/FixJ family response regulator